MTIRHALIIDDHPASRAMTEFVMRDCGVSWRSAETNEDAGRHIEDNSNINLCILRAGHASVDGLQLCRSIRSLRTPSDLVILVILRDEELARGGEFLVAGASDLLVGDFEPRELRMRAGIAEQQANRRIDPAHHANSPSVFVPELDTRRLRFNFGHNQELVEQWDADPLVRQFELDRIIVCPQCEAIPTVRPGCGACGSAWVERENLIHHYACAHVAPAQDFRGAGSIDCPKCRLTDLVAGSDFEQIEGCLRCRDCDAISTETKLIGHCLACQHRFVLSDGLIREIHGYEVYPNQPEKQLPAPNFQNAAAATVQQYGS